MRVPSVLSPPVSSTARFQCIVGVAYRRLRQHGGSRRSIECKRTRRAPQRAAWRAQVWLPRQPACAEPLASHDWWRLRRGPCRDSWPPRARDGELQTHPVPTLTCRQTYCSAPTGTPPNRSCFFCGRTLTCRLLCLRRPPLRCPPNCYSLA